MTLLFIGFILGLLTSRWVDTLIIRLAVRSESEPVRNAARSEARSRGIELREKGRILSTDAWEAAQSLNRPGDVLANLDSDADSHTD